MGDADGEAEVTEPGDGYDSPFVERDERMDVGEALIELGKQLDGRLVRSCEWRIWPEEERREDQIGEATWFDASGAEIERHPRESG